MPKIICPDCLSPDAEIEDDNVITCKACPETLYFKFYAPERIRYFNFLAPWREKRSRTPSS
jgi:hypothetical protein